MLIIFRNIINTRILYFYAIKQKLKNSKNLSLSLDGKLHRHQVTLTSLGIMYI